MKLKALVVLLLLALSVSLLCSCDGGNSGNSAEDSEYVFNSNVDPVFIYSEKLNQASINTVYQAIKDSIGKVPEYGTQDSEAKEHEIVVGETGRAVSRKAYRRLRVLKRDTDDSIGWLIYASGNSVAIAYDEDYDYLTAERAIEYFVENYLAGKTELKLPTGVIASDVFSTIILRLTTKETAPGCKSSRII